MLYYRVKEKFDNRLLQTENNELHCIFGGELITVCELSHFKLTQRQIDNIFEQVNIPRTKTYWSFGVRFELK